MNKFNLFIILGAILFISCKKEKDMNVLEDNNNNGVIVSKSIATEEIIQEIDSFFNEVKQVDVYAYFNRTLWEEEDRKDYRHFTNFENNDVLIKEKYLKNKISLSKDQINKLRENFKDCYDGITEACYDPRHLFVFYNSKNQIIGHIEICFECSNIDCSDNLVKFASCALYSKHLLQEFGITYFEDTEKDIEDYHKRIENE